MTDDSREYYAARSVKERELAAKAADAKIAAIHLKLAERYEILAAGGTIIADDPDKAPISD